MLRQKGIQTSKLFAVSIQASAIPIRVVFILLIRVRIVPAVVRHVFVKIVVG